jgi:hypothetical protein
MEKRICNLLAQAFRGQLTPYVCTLDENHEGDHQAYCLRVLMYSWPQVVPIKNTGEEEYAPKPVK